MTATLERIKKDIQTLEPEELEDLLRDLQSKYALPEKDGGSDADVEAAWDAEIAQRVKDVEEGKVELVSGAEFQRGVDALFSELGMKRSA